MNDHTSDIGLLRRQFRDVHSVVSRLDTQTRKLFEPSAPPRPAGLTARIAACHLIARARHSDAEAVGRQHFGGDNELAQLITKSATGPAMSSSATWAAELAAVAVQDVAQNVLPQSVLAQLRQLSGQDYAFIDGAVVKIPVHSPTPSGGFVGEGMPINVAALIFTALNLKPKKAASIVAITRELANGAPSNVETSLRTLLSQDLGLAVDNVLMSNAAVSASSPAGILNGVTPLTATAGGGSTAMLSDIKKLISAISPCVRPALIMNTTQFASIAILSPPIPLPVIAAPTMPADQVIAIDAFAFASALGQPDFSTDENPAVHMSDAALPIVGGTATPPVIGSVAAPVTSLWQVAAIGLRTLLEADWTMRRSGAVSYITGATW